MYVQTWKIKLTKDVTPLDESYGEWTKVEKPTIVPVSYEGAHNDKEFERVLACNENKTNNYNLVSNLERDDKVEENLFGEQIEDKIEVTPKTTLNLNAVRI